MIINADAYAQKLKKRRRNGIIIIAIILVPILVLFGVLILAPRKFPQNLTETTGTIKKVKQYDEDWLGFIFNETSYFRVWLVGNDMVFVSEGSPYKCIDRALFDDVKVGDEIKITHSKNAIYAIEYNGKHYLKADDVKKVYEDDSKSRPALIIFASVLLGAAVGIAVGAVCYVYRPRKQKII